MLYISWFLWRQFKFFLRRRWWPVMTFSAPEIHGVQLTRVTLFLAVNLFFFNTFLVSDDCLTNKISKFFKYDLNSWQGLVEGCKSDLSFENAFELWHGFLVFFFFFFKKAFFTSFRLSVGYQFHASLFCFFLSIECYLPNFLLNYTVIELKEVYWFQTHTYNIFFK